MPRQSLCILAFFIAGCGGETTPPDSAPDASMSGPDGADTVDAAPPDASPFESPIDLHTFGPSPVNMTGADKTASLDLHGDSITITGTAMADGLALTINSVPVLVNEQHQWTYTEALTPLDCNTGISPQDTFVIKATNALGESMQQELNVVRDSCAPKVTWIPTEVQDESAWVASFTGIPYVPCLSLPGVIPAVTLDGTTPRTVKKYHTNFYADRAGNDTYRRTAGRRPGVRSWRSAPPRGPVETRSVSPGRSRTTWKGSSSSRSWSRNRARATSPPPSSTLVPLPCPRLRWPSS
jgi:hypothetical protein